MQKNKIYVGNNIEILKTFPDNSIDSVVTDPPYGLGKEPNAIEVLTSWIEKGYHEIKGKGFMGKEWDAFVPQPNFWKEIYRVLKPGGHVLSFAGTRTYDWMVMGLRLAGFEVRDMIAWLYGSGFPKSLDIGKAIDKHLGAERDVISKEIRYNEPSGIVNVGQGERKLIERKITAPSTEEAKQWQGWGTALKPSQETICVAQKPIESSSVMVYNDIKEVFICLLKLYVKIVEKSFTLNHQEQSVVSNIAQWIVESNINIQADLQEAMDMLQFLSKENMNLNIVISWLNILADLYKLRNTSTIEMVLSMTIELKILKSLEWENILQNITHHKDNKISGTQQNVLLVEKTFSDLKMKLDYIQTHFVQENATSLGRSKNLSPDLEPIVMARKPLDGTVAQNVLKWGVGGINIDECRIPFEDTKNPATNPLYRQQNKDKYKQVQGGELSNGVVPFTSGKNGVQEQGRFPANVIHDGSDEVVSLFPDSKSGEYKGEGSKSGGIWSESTGKPAGREYGDEGSASRFFYVAKASQEERNFGLSGFEEKSNGINLETQGRTYNSRCANCGKKFIGPIETICNCENPITDNTIYKQKNIHPTVKPIDLMRYLVRLVTPKGGVCLDPFLGSGTTAVACKVEKFDYIGIELIPEYAEIAQARVDAVKDYEATLDTKTIIKESIKEDKEKEYGIQNIFDLLGE